MIVQHILIKNLFVNKVSQMPVVLNFLLLTTNKIGPPQIRPCVPATQNWDVTKH